MRLVIYCQHVLGMGHLFRTLAVAGACARKGFAVTLITGGPRTDVPLPPGVVQVQLPPLAMDENFSGLFSPEGRDVEAVQRERTAMLLHTVRDIRPDVLLTELFPFGRGSFAFELLPLLQAARAGELGPVLVATSVRDILVEKDDPHKYEAKVLKRLNPYYDLVLVHGDAGFIPLDETFGRMADIAPQLAYTGYVTGADELDVQRARAELRMEYGLTDDHRLITASAGGGAVGQDLLERTVRAFGLLDAPGARLHVFTGPYADDTTLAHLRGLADERTTVQRFSSRFGAQLAASDLSVSMAGYNTTMDLLATGLPALLEPFGQNREQAMRATRLVAHTAQTGHLRLLNSSDTPQTIADAMHSMLQVPRCVRPLLPLDGAGRTARLLWEHAQS